MRPNRSGTTKKNLVGEMAYHSFLPAKLPPTPGISLDEEGLGLLARAHRVLDALNRETTPLSLRGVLIADYIKREALSSAQIEGVPGTWEDILAGVESPELEQALNCIKASEYAMEQLNELPLCNRLLREVHRILLSDWVGQSNSPGQFRTSQNWIGAAGSNLQTASYVPPSPEDVNVCMADLEAYMSADEDGADPLVKAALLHYQFETIHPFLDGNGRIGRLLITLFLLEREVLTAPILCISSFFKEHLEEYYHRLALVRETGDYEQWVTFFLRTLSETRVDYIESK